MAGLMRIVMLSPRYGAAVWYTALIADIKSTKDVSVFDLVLSPWTLKVTWEVLIVFPAHIPVLSTELVI